MTPKINRILHTSDWHLGAPVDWRNSEFKEGTWINILRQYRKNAVEQIIGHAIANSLNAVFVAGDLADVYDYTEIIPDIHDFLRSKVIEPLIITHSIIPQLNSTITNGCGQPRCYGTGFTVSFLRDTNRMTLKTSVF